MPPISRVAGELARRLSAGGATGSISLWRRRSLPPAKVEVLPGALVHLFAAKKIEGYSAVGVAILHARFSAELSDDLVNIILRFAELVGCWRRRVVGIVQAASTLQDPREYEECSDSPKPRRKTLPSEPNGADIAPMQSPVGRRPEPFATFAWIACHLDEPSVAGRLNSPQNAAVGVGDVTGTDDAIPVPS